MKKYIFNKYYQKQELQMEAIIYPFRTKSEIFVEKLKLIIWTQVLFSLLVSRKVISHVSVNEKKKNANKSN